MASIAPEPIVGQIATMRIEVVSAVDEEQVTLFTQMSPEIALSGGKATWVGPVRADKPLVHEFTITVREPGQWIIYMTAAALSGVWDEDQLHITSTTDTAQVIPAVDYQFFQSQDEWPGDPAELIPHQFPQHPEPAIKIDPDNPLLLAPVTIEGNITFEFEYEDCINLPCPGIGIGIFPDSAPLRNAQVWLYDRATTGYGHYLATTATDDTGFYSFTVENIDPDGDGTGIDPLLLIFPTGPEGDEKVTIYDSQGDLHIESAVTPDVDLQDGTTYTFDYLIPHVLLQTDIGQAMYVFDQIANEAYPYLQNTVGWSNNEVIKVNYPQGCIFGAVDNSCYLGVVDGISIYDTDGRRADVIIHEYGHFVLSRYLGDSAVIHACAPVYNHDFDEATIAPSCAWSEGWSDFLQMAVQGDPDYVGIDIETPHTAYLPAPGDIPEYWEAVVGATLWDIFDPAGAESGGFTDPLDDDFNGAAGNGIWHFSTQLPLVDLPTTIQEFLTQWGLTRTPTDHTHVCDIMGEYRFLYYNLALSVTPANAGTLLLEPSLHCPNGMFIKDNPVDIWALAEPGFIFAQWSGDAGGSVSPLTVWMDDNKNITAEFSYLETPTLTPTHTPTNTPTPTITPTPTPPSPQTIIIPVMAASDDAGPTSACVNQNSDDTPFHREIYFGYCSDNTRIVSGLRFASVPVPRGSTITNATLRFTVDGTYTQGLNLQINAHHTANSPTFVEGTPVSSRSPIAGQVLWGIPSSDVWQSGQIRYSPDISYLIDLVVNYTAGWQMGNPITLVVQPSANGSGFRRVFAYERTGSSAAAWLEITYIPPTPTPTPTATSLTPAPTPTPVPTMTSTPAPTATPGGPICVLGAILVRGDTSPFGRYVAKPVRYVISKLQQTGDMIELLYRLRDEVMGQTSAGQSYINLYYTHTEEVNGLVLADSALFQQARDTTMMFYNHVEALVNGNGGSVVITAGEIQALQSFLDNLMAAGSPALQQAISTELTNHPLEGFVGMTVDGAWNSLNAPQPTPTPDPNYAACEYREVGETLVIEAEHYAAQQPGSGNAQWHSWVDAAQFAGFAGSRAVWAFPNDNVSTLGQTNGPRLDFPIRITTPGNYYLFVRGRAEPADTANQAVHLGIDGSLVTTGSSGLNGFVSQPNQFNWQSWSGGSLFLTAGSHTLNLWMLQDGLLIDRIMLSTNPNRISSGSTAVGPAESLAPGGCVERPPAPTWLTAVSIAVEDGYIREDGNTNTGGLINNVNGALRVGDDTSNRQLKGFVSFDTSSIPEEATIVSGRLRLKHDSLAGSPFNLGSVLVDIAPLTGFSSSYILEASDFQAAAGLEQVTTLSQTSGSNEWAEGYLNVTGLAALNTQGTTQLRLVFSLPDDGDGLNDYIQYNTGDAMDAFARPQLIIAYSLASVATATPTVLPTATSTPTDTPTPTYIPTSTPTYTATPTYTPTPTSTYTPTPAPTPTPVNTGFRSPSANTANKGGDDNGFEANPANAYSNNGVFAIDNNSGTNNGTEPLCDYQTTDKHQFYDYSFTLPGSATITGIEVRLDAKADSTAGSPMMCVELSWDGGTTWTAPMTTPVLTTSENTYILGGASTTWGHVWNATHFSNANFRLRIVNLASVSSRDFSLDWVAVKAYYQP